MIKKIFISITVGIISIMAVAAVTKAFTGPGSQPPTGNPVFWTKSGNDVYYNVVGGNVGVGLTGPAYKLDVNGPINAAASGGLCIAGVCKTNWDQVQGTSYWTQSGSNLYASSTTWNVGIGNTDPGSYKLKVTGTTQTTGFQLGTSATAGQVLTADASGVGTWQAVSALPSGTSGQTLRHNGTTWVANSGLYNNGSYVGIWTSGAGVSLDVLDTNGTTIRVGRSPLSTFPTTLNLGTDGSSGFISSSGGAGALIFRINDAEKVRIDTTGNVGIGTASPGSNKLAIVGGNLDLGGNNITGVNKITAVSIDPVFKINGKNYATYVSDFAGGLRVETSGVLKLNSSYEIDFNNLNEGSDLWLFWQASNKNINNLSVILTPGFDGKVWYEKGENKIIIHTEKPGEISYRLSAQRIDNKDGNNLAEDQSIKGIDILDYLK